DPNADAGVPRVLRTGRPEFYPEIPEALLEANAQDAEHLALLRELGLRSAIVVPLVARGRMLGALTLVTAASDRLYTEADLVVAGDLGHQAGMAVDNARLYVAEQRARAAAEHLAAITQAIGASLTPTVLLDQIAAAAAELLGSAFAGVFLLESR